MLQYEVTFIVDPVLSGDEIKSTAQTYEDLIKDEGGEIVNIDAMGLKQLAYPINKRTSGVYFCIEFKPTSGDIIPKMELAFRRDERVMRFLTVRMDKYHVQYAQDRRDGKIGTVKKKEKKKDSKGGLNKKADKKADKPAETKTEAKAAE